MGLDDGVKHLVETNLETSIDVFREIKSSEDALNRYTDNFKNVQNNYDFIHGHMMGQLEGESFATVRTHLGRPLTDEESTDLAAIVKSKRNKVSELIEQLKMG